MFLSTFHNVSVDRLSCDVPGFAKYYCASFLLSSMKPSKPLSLIHFDILGPIKNLNVTGAW